MKRLLWIVALTACLGPAFTACEAQRKQDASDASDPPTGGTATSDLAAVAQANNEFAFDLYRQLSRKPGNLFFSPYSISTALAMTYAGARGRTATEMARTLHFELPDDRLHSAYGALIRKVQGADSKRKYTLNLANRLWGQKSGLTIEPRFQRILETDYGAGFQPVDFAADPEAARGTINSWVADKTNKKIEDLLPKGLIDTHTRMVLANAIHFKSDWAFPFPEGWTKPGAFSMPDGRTIQVPMMHRILETKYLETAEFQLAEFMYRDNEVSMVVILPKKRPGLREVEMRLSRKDLAQSLVAAQLAPLDVTLPRLKVVQAFDVGNELAALGMKDAFAANADFSGISSSDHLRISAVVHKSFIKIEEAGTEAAAATAIVMNNSSAIDFHANHPFLFLLRHKDTASILFIGRVSDPRGN